MRGLPQEVKTLIHKARDAAILAVETYNRPTASFRSGAYVILMTVAWTMLFHAIFFREGRKPFYRKKGSRRFERVDGDKKAWELSECLKQYHGPSNPPERYSVQFFIGLRNKLEHRTLPHLDTDIFGECQSLLMNFEQLLTDKFGRSFALKTGLAFALQFSPTLQTSQSKTMTNVNRKQFAGVKSYIDTFRSSLTDDIGKDLKYSFRVFLVPKVNNHAQSADAAIEFVKYDPQRPEEMRKYEHLVAFIKEKQVSVSNLGYLRAGQVVAQVAKRIYDKFNQYDHLLCYRHFRVRPYGKVVDPTFTDTRYCVYDAVHKDYVYKPEWVDFLVGKLFQTTLLDELRETGLVP